MPSVTNPFRKTDVIFLLLAVAVVALYVAFAGGGFPLDDSWIHQVYGRNLAQTGRWAFIPGQQSAASTSPLYTVVLAVGYVLNVPYELWAHLMGVLALASAGMLAARMAEKVLADVRFVGEVAGVTVILTWHLVWAAASGMETMLFSFLTLLLIYRAWREVDKTDETTQAWLWRAVGFGVLAALTTLARPEGAVLTALIGFVMLIAHPQGSLKQVLQWGIVAGVAYVIVMLPYLLLNLQITGGLLPDTAAAKQAQFAAVLERFGYPARFWRMTLPILAGGQLLVLPGVVYVGYVLWQKRKHSQLLIYGLPLLWAVTLIGLYAARLPADYQHGRYVIPALPGVVAIGAAGLTGLVVLAKESMIGRVVTRTLALSAGATFAYFLLLSGLLAYRTDVRIIEEEMVASAHWIAEHIPVDETLAIHDIGAVGYFAPRPMLDIAGLVTPEVIPIVEDADALWAWLEENDARYLMAFPDQIPGNRVDDPRLCLMFNTNGPTSQFVGGPNMAVYALAWDGQCDG